MASRVIASIPLNGHDLPTADATWLVIHLFVALLPNQHVFVKAQIVELQHVAGHKIPSIPVGAHIAAYAYLSLCSRLLPVIAIRHAAPTCVVLCWWVT